MDCVGRSSPTPVAGLRTEAYKWEPYSLLSEGK